MPQKDETATDDRWPRYVGGGWFAVPEVRGSNVEVKVKGRARALKHLETIGVEPETLTGSEVRSRKQAAAEAAEQRRQLVASLRLRARTIEEIAQAVGVGVATVHRDLEIIRQRWLDSQVQHHDQRMVEQLAKLDLIEAGLWRAVEGGRRLVGLEDYRDQNGEWRKRAVYADLKPLERARLSAELRNTVETRSRMLGLEQPDIQALVFVQQHSAGGEVDGRAVLTIGGSPDSMVTDLMLSQGATSLDEQRALMARAQGHLEVIDGGAVSG